MRRIAVRRLLRAWVGAGNYRVQRNGEIHVYTSGAWAVVGNLGDPDTLDQLRRLEALVRGERCSSLKK